MSRLGTGRTVAEMTVVFQILASAYSHTRFSIAFRLPFEIHCIHVSTISSVCAHKGPP